MSRRLLSFEPAATELLDRAQQCIHELQRACGVHTQDMTMIVGTESYDHLVAYLTFGYNKPGASGACPSVVTPADFLGLKIIVDPTRTRFVAVVPTDPAKCWLMFSGTDGKHTIGVPNE